MKEIKQQLKEMLEPTLKNTLKEYLMPRDYGVDLAHAIDNYFKQNPEIFEEITDKPYKIEVTPEPNNSYKIRVEFEVTDPEERQRLLDAGFEEVK